MATHRDYLRLEAVRGNKPGEMVNEVQTDRLDAARGAGDHLFGGEALLDGRPVVVGAVGEDAVEHLIDGLPDDLQLGEPALGVFSRGARIAEMAIPRPRNAIHQYSLHQRRRKS